MKGGEALAVASGRGGGAGWCTRRREWEVETDLNGEQRKKGGGWLGFVAMAVESATVTTWWWTVVDWASLVGAGKRWRRRERVGKRWRRREGAGGGEGQRGSWARGRRKTEE